MFIHAKYIEPTYHTEKQYDNKKKINCSIVLC